MVRLTVIDDNHTPGFTIKLSKTIRINDPKILISEVLKK